MFLVKKSVSMNISNLGRLAEFAFSNPLIFFFSMFLLNNFANFLLNVIEVNAGAYIEFLPWTADRICYLEKKLEYVQLFSGRKFEVSQENKKKNEKNK
jgi:hypothetical protein